MAPQSMSRKYGYKAMAPQSGEPAGSFAAAEKPLAGLLGGAVALRLRGRLLGGGLGLVLGELLARGVGGVGRDDPALPLDLGVAGEGAAQVRAQHLGVHTQLLGQGLGRDGRGRGGGDVGHGASFARAREGRFPFGNVREHARILQGGETDCNGARRMLTNPLHVACLIPHKLKSDGYPPCPPVRPAEPNWPVQSA